MAFSPKRPGDRFRWAYRVTRSLKLTSSECAVLLNLAYRWNREKGFAFPSWDRIASDTSLHRQTVGTAVKSLERKGVIGRFQPPGRQKNGGRLATEYTLNFYAPQSSESPEGLSGFRENHGRNDGGHGRVSHKPQSSESTPTGYLTGNAQPSVSRKKETAPPTSGGAQSHAEDKATKAAIYEAVRALAEKCDVGEIGGLIAKCIENVGLQETERLVLELQAEVYCHGSEEVDLRYELGCLAKDR